MIRKKPLNHHNIKIPKQRRFRNYLPDGKMTVYDIMNWIGEKQKEKNRKINIEERRPVAINKLKRQMQYRFVRGTIRARRYMQKPTEGRPVETNKMKRMKQYRSVRGAI